MTDTIVRYRDIFAAQRAAVPVPEFWSRLQTESFERFTVLGFPGRTEEAWRYTDTRPIAEGSFSHPGDVVDEAGLTKLIDENRVENAWAELVFVDGIFAPSFSRFPSESHGVTTGAIAMAKQGATGSLETWLGRVCAPEEAPFVALNMALARDGAWVEVPRDVRLDHPIHILHISPRTTTSTEVHLRNLITVGPGASATVLETYAGFDQGLSSTKRFVNAVTEVVIGGGASLTHLMWQRQPNDVFHVASTGVRQGQDSRYHHHGLWLGASLSRSDLVTRLEGKGAEADLFGLYLAGGDQHVDNHTVVDHRVPHCRSQEVYKGVLAQRAHGVFNGIVYVRPDASKTDASQANHNLLLSDDAAVDTKPQLEIFNDDVKCSHGSTVGQLDDDALFYLRSRGLRSHEARQLLTVAFVREVLERIREPTLREQAQRWAHHKLREISPSEQPRP